MIHNISTPQGFAVMGAAFAALVAMIADYYTTMVGTQHGLTEANPLNAWLFKKIGQPLTTFFEAAAVCWIGAYLTDFGAGPASLFFGGIALAESITALLNYRKLKAAKISLS